MTGGDSSYHPAERLDHEKDDVDDDDEDEDENGV